MDRSLEAFDAWYAALEKRHLADLRFAEVRRALQALSVRYVERRDKLGKSDPLGSAGKRAAYSLFYGPLHFLLILRIVRELGAATPSPRTIVDLGCGTGAASAAWALEARRRPRLLGIDRNSWTLEEARRTWADLRLKGTTRRGSVEEAKLPPGADLIVAYTANEVTDEVRSRLRNRLLAAADRGSRVLVVEPLSRRVAPWWPEWADSFTAAGGRADEWSFPVRLPEKLHLLDKAAGLRHQKLAGRSLWLDSAYRSRGAAG